MISGIMITVFDVSVPFIASLHLSGIRDVNIIIQLGDGIPVLYDFNTFPHETYILNKKRETIIDQDSKFTWNRCGI